MAVTNLVITSLGSNEFQDTANANSAIVVKASSGTLYALVVDNSANGAASYVKMWDSAGAVVVGTTAPDWVFKVPASTRQPIVAAPGVAFGAGLQVATVTAGGTAGTTSPTSSVQVNIVYS